MHDLGVFHILGALWSSILQKLEDSGVATAYTDNVGIESFPRLFQEM